MVDEQTKAKINTSKDYYYILGIRPDATTEEIQDAYDELYDKFGPHVSVQGMDPDILIRQFKDICDAYEILTNPGARREYDKNSTNYRQTGDVRALWGKVVSTTKTDMAAMQQQPGQLQPQLNPQLSQQQQYQQSAAAPQMPPQQQQSPQQPSAQASQMQSLRQAQAQSEAQPAQQAPAPTQPPVESKPKANAVAILEEVEVTVKEAMKGFSVDVQVTEPVPCENCMSQKPMNRQQCANCRGLGYRNTERVEHVDLPGGMYDNQDIRFPERGRYDLRAGARGELIVRVKVKPHPYLEIMGRDLTITVPLTIYEAMLGTEIEVPTATGKVVMKTQPLSQPGRVYRLKGLGLGGGDQLVTIEVVWPQKLSAEEMQLYKKLKDMSKEPNPRANLFPKSDK